MGAKRRDRHAPYYAEHSAAHDANNARNQCRLARLGARAVGMPWLYDLSRRNDQIGRRIGRTLVNKGREVAEAREKERRERKEFEVPKANTSFGVGIESEFRYTKADETRSKIFKLACKLRCEKAMEWLKKDRPDKAQDALLEAITG